MTVVQIELSEMVAEQARQAGLLAPGRLEELIREQLRKQAGEELLQMVQRIHEANETPPMSLEEIAAEVREVRRAKRVP